MARLRVKEIALQRGIADAAKLARRADTAYGTVKKVWDDPNADVSVKTLEKIAGALQVSVRDLFEDEPEPEILTPIRALALQTLARIGGVQPALS